MVIKNAVFMRLVAFRKRLVKQNYERRYTIMICKNCFEEIVEGNFYPNDR